MAVRVLFFGSTATITGKRQLDVEHEAGANAQQVIDTLLTEFPGLSAHRLLLAVNQEFATGEEVLRDGDELAIFTAVSGG